MSNLEKTIERVLGRNPTDDDRAGIHDLSALPESVAHDADLIAHQGGSVSAALFLRMQTGASLRDIKEYAVERNWRFEVD